MEANISLGFLSNALAIASRLSMEGRLAPRSMELIWLTLSRAASARSFSDQSRSARSSRMRWPSCGIL